MLTGNDVTQAFAIGIYIHGFLLFHKLLLHFTILAYTFYNFHSILLP